MFGLRLRETEPNIAATVPSGNLEQGAVHRRIDFRVLNWYRFRMRQRIRLVSKRKRYQVCESRCCPHEYRILNESSTVDYHVVAPFDRHERSGHQLRQTVKCSPEYSRQVYDMGPLKVKP